MKTPILFIIFNRPETTKKVFMAIKKARPEKLYISSDGPRPTRSGDKEKIKATRRLVLNNIDWPCEIKTRFQTTNLGCGKNVSDSIGWFFKQEKQGIILEDDCLPNQSFFSYCEILLDRYKDEPRVMHISGDQFAPNSYCPDSYYFAEVMHCWGWASWSDRWSKYDFSLKSLPLGKLKKAIKNPYVCRFWCDIYQRMRNKEIDTWDYQWALIIIANEGLCINPKLNQISNIGFGSEATHTKTPDEYSNLQSKTIKILQHPKKLVINKKSVYFIYKKHFSIKFKSKFQEFLSSILLKMS